MSSSEKLNYDSIGRDAGVVDYDKLGAVDPMFMKKKTPAEQKAIDLAREKFLEKGEKSDLERSRARRPELKEEEPAESDKKGPAGKKEPSGKKEPKDVGDSKSVLAAIEDVRSHPRFLSIDIYFKSKFAHGHEVSEQILQDLPKDADLYKAMQEAFDWVKYEAKVDRDIRGYEIKYTFTKSLKGLDVSKKNMLEDEPYTEKLTADGSTIPESNEAFKTLHDWMMKTVLPEGILPKGAYAVEFHNIAHSSTEDPSHPDFTPLSYPGTRFFKVMHHKIFKKDAPHQDWEQKRDDFLERKKFGPLERIPGHEVLIKEIKDLKTMIENESDEKVKKDHEVQIDKLQNKMKEDLEKSRQNKDYLSDRIQDLRSQRKDILLKDIARMDAELKAETDKRAITKLEEGIKGLKNKLKDMEMAKSAMVYRVTFPEPGTGFVYAAEIKPRPRLLSPEDSGEEVKELIQILDKYGLTNKPNPRGWLTPADFKVLARTLNHTINAEKSKKIKDLKKKDPKEIDRIEKEAQVTLDRVIELFPAFIKDFKFRALKYEDAHPADFKTFQTHDWIKDDDKINSLTTEAKHYLTEKIELKTEKQPQVTGLEFDSFRQLFGYLDSMKRGFKNIALSLKKAPVLQEGSPDLAEKYKGAMDILSEIRNSHMDEQKALLESIKEIEKENLSPEDRKELEEFKKEEEATSNKIKELENRIKPGVPNTPGELSNMLKEEAAHLETCIKRTQYLLKVMPEMMKKYPDTRMEAKNISKMTFLSMALTRYEQIKKDLETNKRINDPKAPDNDPELKKEVADLKSYHKDIKGEIDKLLEKQGQGAEKITKDDKAELERIKTELDSLEPELKDITRSLNRFLPSSPATHMMETIKSFVKYFESLYNTLSKTVTFKEKYEPWYEPVRASDDEVLEVEAAEKKEPPSKEELVVKLNKLKGVVVQDSMDVAKIDIKHDKEIKSALDSLKAAIRDFLKIFYDESGPFRAEYITRYAADEKETALMKKIKDKEKEVKDADGTKKEKAQDELDDLYAELRQIKLVNFRIPEDQRYNARKVIEKMKGSDNNKVKEAAGAAEKAWDGLVEEMTDAYNKGFTGKQVEALADKKYPDIKNRKSAYKKAGEELLKHQEALSHAIVEDFILRWDKFRKDMEEYGSEDKTKKEFNVDKDSHIATTVKHTIPDLFKQTPPADEEEFEIPTPGKPTPKHIREMIEREFTSEKELSHEDLVDLYKSELKSGEGEGGGGGGKGKSKRKKVIRPNPPSYSGDLVRRETVDLFNKTTKGEEIIDDVVVSYLSRVKDQFDKMGPDEYMDPQKVLNHVRTVLLTFYNGMKKLKVFPSYKIELPPPGAPPYSGSPDIAMDSLKDAEDFLKKFTEAVEEINWYLETEKLTLPTLKYDRPTEWGKPGGKGKDERWLPFGFVDWLFWWGNNQGFKFDRPTKVEPGKIFRPSKPIEETAQPGREETKLKEVKKVEQRIKEELQKRFKDFKEKFEKERAKSGPAEKKDWEKLYEEKFKKQFPGLTPPKSIPKTPRELEEEALANEFKKHERETRGLSPNMELLKKGEIDYPTQMSANVAARFIGVELPKDELDAVMS